VDKKTTMIAAARGAMENVLDLVPVDRVVVVLDEATRGPGEAFAAAAREVGCATRIYELPEDDRPLTAMPDGMGGLLEDATVVINAIAGRSDEVPFRIEWLNAVEGTKRIRMGHSPGIDEGMMTGGPMDVDYAAMRETEARLIGAMRDAEAIHITAPGGSDITLGVAGRRFESDLHATVEHGANLPCGEIFLAPLETGAEGRLVCDGCFGDEPAAAEPIRFEVVAGRVVEMDCADERVRAKVQGWLDTDEGAPTIAELGIGLNPGARLRGSMLEDEKAFRTIHIAFGSNEGFPGGENESKVHIDYLVMEPTVTARFADGSETIVMRRGDVVV
jgi:leucyl aminopeptidase (aminopeptidase T)